MELHLNDKVAKAYEKESDEFNYLQSVINYCREAGVVRFEQKLKSAFLRKYNFCFYGLFDEKQLKPTHDELLAIDEKLQVTAMTTENIAERLIRQEIVTSTHAANVTSMYAIQWMHGTEFDLSKTQVRVHRARLRKIGIDIGIPCDTSRHSPVFIRKVKEIEVQPLEMPSWYQPPGRKPNLKLVA